MSDQEKRDEWTRQLENLLKMIPDGIKTQRVSYGKIELGIRVNEN